MLLSWLTMLFPTFPSISAKDPLSKAHVQYQLLGTASWKSMKSSLSVSKWHINHITALVFVKSCYTVCQLVCAVPLFSRERMPQVREPCDLALCSPAPCTGGPRHTYKWVKVWEMQTEREQKSSPWNILNGSTMGCWSYFPSVTHTLFHFITYF